jgi:hypothetical protein
MTSLEKALRDFAQFAAKLKGDEKSEAQTFLFHLLAAFLAKGATAEWTWYCEGTDAGRWFSASSGKCSRSEGPYASRCSA